MNKKVLIISTSPRKNGNSEILANSFAKGAESVGNEVEKVCLYNKRIGFCKGCLCCQKTGRCVIHDDADIIAQKMGKSDVIVFATPIYYYEMSGQMKTMLDRANPLYDSEYKFTDIYLLATAAEDEDTAIDGAIRGLNGWVSCFERAKLKGVVKAVNVDDIGAINGNSAIDEAFEIGANIT